jgi:hypothetical protein
VWEIHQTIPTGERLNIELLKIAEASWYGPLAEMFGRAPAEYAQLESSEFEDLKRNMQTDKYVPTFLMPDSESYFQLYRFLKSRFRTFDCKASAKFIRLSDGSNGSIDVPCKGAFRLRGVGLSRQ